MRQEGYEETSPCDDDYNCVAWALGRTDRWYEPGNHKGSYWPPGLRHETSISAYVALFESVGYERTLRRESEPGFERVAIYGIDDDFCHVARQVLGGWSSKCGRLYDIRHSTLRALEDFTYGEAVVILRRLSSVTEPPLPFEQTPDVTLAST